MHVLSIPLIRLHNGKLFAEIIEDRRSDQALFFAIVQRQGSPEVLLLAQFHSCSEAEAAAKQFMADYASQKNVSREGAA